MNAIVLAGGGLPPAIAAEAGVTATERGLLDINGRPAIDYILESLRATPEIERIVVVAPPETLKFCERSAVDVVPVPAQSTLSENVLAGTRACEATGDASAQVLICTCDIPLTTAATWVELLRGVREAGLDAAYPIVRRETMDAAFPGGKRTYATLTDGAMTGGNAFVLPVRIVENLTGLIAIAHKARKNPLGLAKILGLNFLIKAVRKRLSVADIAEKMSQTLKCRAGAVEMKDATIAFDVDKPEDYELAQRALEKIVKAS